jgi:enoyl-CoA hydratase
MSRSPEVRLERRGALALLRMDDGKANTFDLDLLRDLGEAFEEARRQDAGALVLTGGGRIFSAGVDLHQVLAGGRGYLAEFLPVLKRTLEAIFSYPLPVVAALNGHALAGGCILALACDHRVAAEGPARLGIPELRAGVPFISIGLEIARSALSEQVLRDLVYTGRSLGLEEALRLGVVDVVVPADDLLERAFETAGRLAAIPTTSFGIVKRQLRLPILDRCARLEDADKGVLDAWAAPEVHVAVHSYLEATLGRFRGQEAAQKGTEGTP